MTDIQKLQHIRDIPKIKRKWNNLTNEKKRKLLESFPEQTTEKALTKAIERVRKAL
ncbi:MAG: hypothetical protein KF855_03180 [Acidobacteria bacterium]|nr:hypothetical protein [Acidobacteriota bacterium]